MPTMNPKFANNKKKLRIEEVSEHPKKTKTKKILVQLI
jgi:hypothetical protein